MGDPCQALGEAGNLSGLAEACGLQEEATRFAEFFQGVVSASPWSLQLAWAKRVFLRHSFAILPPTGVGKTTFGLVMAAYLTWPSYIVVPTRLLVEELSRRLSRFAPGKRVLGYTEKAEEKECVAAGDFDILVTTSAFLQRNSELLLRAFGGDADRRKKFVFVDDVDSLLKASRNVDRVLGLLGFSPEEVEAALAGEEVGREPEGVLAVSSATARPRTKRVVLFQRLLGFEVQRPTTSLRNVADLEVQVDSFNAAMTRAVEIVGEFGPGAFVYVSQPEGRAGAERTVEALRRAGIPAVLYEEFDTEAQKKFRKGEIWAAVGISHGGNPLVRGIDLPEAVRYVVFLEVPTFPFPTEISSIVPRRLLPLLLALRHLLLDEEVERDLEYLRRYLALREEDLPRYLRIRERLEGIAAQIRRLFADEAALRELRSSGPSPWWNGREENFSPWPTPRPTSRSQGAPPAFLPGASPGGSRCYCGGTRPSSVT